HRAGEHRQDFQPRLHDQKDRSRLRPAQLRERGPANGGHPRRVQRRPRAGRALRVAAPAAVARPRGTEVGGGLRRRTMATSSTFRRYIDPNPRVLIVDDNRAIHEDFRKTLGASVAEHDELAALEAELFGASKTVDADVFELTSAYQGEEALDLVRQARDQGEPFALAFVDVRMPPGLDGVATTERLLEQDPDINIVICSAYSDHSWEEIAATIGKTDRVLILKKPFDTIEVRQLAHAL